MIGTGIIIKTVVNTVKSILKGTFKPLGTFHKAIEKIETPESFKHQTDVVRIITTSSLLALLTYLLFSGKVVPEELWKLIVTYIN